MASVTVTTEPMSNIEYSIVDGRILGFDLRGKKLYDEQNGTVTTGWETKLVDFVQEQGFDINRGHGLHAFVYRMQDDGLLHKPVIC